MAGTPSVTVEFSHAVTVKILVPALEHLIQRTHELVDRIGEEPPYATWVRENGYLLLDTLRDGLLETPWGTKPLRVTLDADELGLLAAALGAVRRHAAGAETDPDLTALEEARQRLWLTISLDTELVWWIAYDVATSELLPILRACTGGSPSERARAADLLRTVEAHLREPLDGALRLRTRLSDLAWLAERVPDSVMYRRLHALLDQLVDPLVRQRLARSSTSRTAGATASGTAGSPGGRAEQTAGSQTTAGRPGSALGEPAPIVHRLLAAVIDLFAFGAGAQLIAALAPILFTGTSRGIVILDPQLYDFVVAILELIVPVGGWYLYWVYPVGRWGQTLGKRAVSIQVVTAGGAPPGQAKVLGRVIIAGLLAWLLLLPWWPVPFRLDRRGLHDLAVDVWVVRSSNG